MIVKPKITGRPGAYVCRSSGGWVGRGRTPLEAFRNMHARVDMLRRIFGPFLMSR